MLFFLAVEKIRQRWKSIRDSYVKYINKIRDTPGSKVRPYKFEKQLKFLAPFLTGQKDGTGPLEDNSSSETTEEVVLTVVDSSHQQESPESKYNNEFEL